MLFRRLALHRFIRDHKPAQDVAPAAPALVDACRGILPDSLLELWQKKGIGFYGARQFALIDPRDWQPVLDRWICRSGDEGARIPIALSPFGLLFYFRRLSDTQTDIVYINPVTVETDVIAWGLEDFFSGFMCDPRAVEQLMPPGLIASVWKECGLLEAGQVYVLDQDLLAAQVVKAGRVDALALHRHALDQVQAASEDRFAPKTIAEAVPPEHVERFDAVPQGEGLAGLYLSEYHDRYRLLALAPDGTFQLLHWQVIRAVPTYANIRLCSGSFALGQNDRGDRIVALDLVSNAGSVDGDTEDRVLVAMRAGDQDFLLRETALDRIAAAIAERNVLGHSDGYFRRIALDDPYFGEPNDGRAAPPPADLPNALRALIHD